MLKKIVTYLTKPTIMKNTLLFVVSVLPFFAQSQVTYCHKSIQKKSAVEKWEKVNYRLCIYEFIDTTLLQRTAQLLSLNPKCDRGSENSETITWILTMSFKKEGKDSMVCNVTLSEKPYLYPGLMGCCLIGGRYAQIVGDTPTFMKPTKNTAAFSYISHKVFMGKYNGAEYEREEMGDDSFPQWELKFLGEDVQLLKYYGIDE